jgi:hypothetical protein
VWFDENDLGSVAGLVPLFAPAAQTRLGEIITGKVSIRTPGIGLNGQFGAGDKARPALSRGFGRRRTW